MVTLKKIWNADTREKAEAFFLLFAVILSVANLILLFRDYGRIQSAQSTRCSFYADIGAAPISSAVGYPPPRLAVLIVSDARAAWKGLPCMGYPIKPPDPSFVRWARYYQIPVNK
jgi:hypothetical protein